MNPNQWAKLKCECGKKVRELARWNSATWCDWPWSSQAWSKIASYSVHVALFVATATFLLDLRWSSCAVRCHPADLIGFRSRGTPTNR